MYREEIEPKARFDDRHHSFDEKFRRVDRLFVGKDSLGHFLTSMITR